MKKRVLSALLVLCLACGLVSTAWAADGQATPETAAVSVTDAASGETAQEETTSDETVDASAYPARTVEQTVPGTDVTVQVEVPEGALPEDAELTTALVGSSEDNADDQAVADVAAELNDAGVEYDGFVALDISFVDADGNKVEPQQPVSVNFTLPAELLPEDVDASTLEVQHLEENAAGEVENVQTVADTADATEGTVTVDGEAVVLSEDTDTTLSADAQVAAEFTVDGFSSFTITWKSQPRINFKAHAAYMQEDGGIQEIDGEFTYPSLGQDDVSLQDAVNVSNINVPDITSHSGQTYYYASQVYIQNGSTLTRVYYLRNNRGTWQYLDTNTWSEDSNWHNFWQNSTVYYSTVYFIFEESDQTTTELKSIQTVDTSDSIQISLYDYDLNGINSASGNFDFGSNNRKTEFGWNAWNSGRGSYQGIVKNKLVENPEYVNGQRVTVTYPQFNTGINNGESLEYLFSDSRIGIQAARTGLNHLFKDDNGYLLYDSGTNFASIVATDGNNTANDSDFVVYEKPYSGTDSSASQQAKFAPFNELTDYDNYKGGNNNVDYYFGMRISFNFWQPEDGQIDGEDMVFEFSGDDDVWIFIDDALVLDIGGIHDEMSGSINFATGDVELYYDSDGNTVHTTLKEMLREAGVLTNNADWNGNTFKDRTQHSFDMFYLERGAGGSNCRIRFNMPPVPTNSLLVEKDVSSDSEEAKYFLGDFEYQYQVVDEHNESLLNKGDTYDIYDASTNEKIDTGTVGDDGIFTLKDGQQARFTAQLDDNGYATKYDFLLQTSTKEYYVRELLEDDYVAQYGNVQLTVSNDGGSQVDQYDPDSDEGQHYNQFTTCTSGKMQGSDGTNYVVFNNQIDTSELTTLHVRKEVVPLLDEDSETSFTIKLSINGVPLTTDTQYQLLAADGEAVGEPQNVGAGGTIKLQHDQEVVILSRIVAGSEISIQELNDSSYTVSYKGQIQDSNEWSNDGFELTTSNGVATGTVTTTGKPVRVVVTNAHYDLYTSLPVLKQLTGYSAGSYTFNFAVTEMQLQGDEYVEKETQTANTHLQGATVTIDSTSDANGTQGMIYFGYDSSVGTSTYYYKVSETAGSDTGISYDNNYYIVKVDISEEAGNKKAVIASVEKYNAQGEKDTSFIWSEANQQVPFVNSMFATLTVTKQVTGDMGSRDKAFTFTLSLTKTEEGKTTYYGSDNETIRVVSSTMDGYTTGKTLTPSQSTTGEVTYSFQLQHDKNIVLEVPYGYTATLHEEADGYTASFTVDGESVEGTQPAPVMNENHTVAYTNRLDPVAPTGLESNHTAPYTILVTVAGIAGLALIGGIVARRRRRRME